MALLGIDAGGTKIHYALCTEKGELLHTLLTPSFSLIRCGEEAMHAKLQSDIQRLLQEAGLSPALQESINAVCYGVPGWGESETYDATMTRIADKLFEGAAVFLCNDSQVGWAGSFALRPGINVVAGTGAIAFGKDAYGNVARCGGWGYAFSDEGSGYWLGRKTMELFCKQADGRLPRRGPLYSLMRKAFGVANDFRIVEIVEQEYLPYREKIASLQLLLLDAAKAGDEAAIVCYQDAGREIARNVQGVRKKLTFDGKVPVSYSGGIFKVGPMVLDSFLDSLCQFDCMLVEPIAPPWVGALMIALTLLPGDHTDAIAELIQHTKLDS